MDGKCNFHKKKATYLIQEKYDCGSIYFESNDNGETWDYAGLSEDYESMY